MSGVKSVNLKKEANLQCIYRPADVTQSKHCLLDAPHHPLGLIPMDPLCPPQHVLPPFPPLLLHIAHAAI